MFLASKKSALFSQYIGDRRLRESDLNGRISVLTDVSVVTDVRSSLVVGDKRSLIVSPRPRAREHPGPPPGVPSPRPAASERTGLQLLRQAF